MAINTQGVACFDALQGKHLVQLFHVKPCERRCFFR